MVVLRKKIIFVVLFLLFKTKVLSFGSIDTTMAGNPDAAYVTFGVYPYPPVFDPNTYVKGFAAFLWGFAVPSGSKLRFGSTAPVRSMISLNGGNVFNPPGTLELTDDLYLGNNTTIGGPGTIILNGHFIHLSSEILINNGDVHITGSGGFAGNGNVINLQSKLIFDQLPDERPSFTLDNITLKYVSNVHTFQVNTIDPAHPIRMSFIDTTLMLYTFVLDTPAPLVFGGSLDILGSSKILGTGLKMTCQYPITIHQGSTLTIDNGVTFDIGPNSGINFRDASGSFVLNNATLDFESTTTFKTGNFVVQGSSIISSTSSGRRFYFGGSGQDPTITINPGSKLTVADGTTVMYTG